ncbi:hypothetical protein BC830DRAFT_1216206 [Chytriomyces sp. MP71]|nr:hypothetical protein BC830DRAFT_1216206 [Chytriomyces sp. MP71]
MIEEMSSQAYMDMAQAIQVNMFIECMEQQQQRVYNVSLAGVASSLSRGPIRLQFFARQYDSTLTLKPSVGLTLGFSSESAAGAELAREMNNIGRAGIFNLDTNIHKWKRRSLRARKRKCWKIIPYSEKRKTGILPTWTMSQLGIRLCPDIIWSSSGFPCAWFGNIGNHILQHWIQCASHLWIHAQRSHSVCEQGSGNLWESVDDSVVKRPPVSLMSISGHDRKPWCDSLILSEAVNR